MRNALEHDLNRLLKRVKPNSLLLVGEGAHRLSAGYLGEHPGCVSAQADDLDQLLGAKRDRPYEMALVVDALEHMDKGEALALLARLRDVSAHQVVVAVPIGDAAQRNQSSWSAEDMVAMGMYRAGTYEQDGVRVHVYCFDLYDYKPTPDWLNARFWAHPELFDKYWW
jgi:hypothetical protein